MYFSSCKSTECRRTKTSSSEKNNWMSPTLYTPTILNRLGIFSSRNIAQPEAGGSAAVRRRLTARKFGSKQLSSSYKSLACEQSMLRSRRGAIQTADFTASADDLRHIGKEPQPERGEQWPTTRSSTRVLEPNEAAGTSEAKAAHKAPRS